MTDARARADQLAREATARIQARKGEEERAGWDLPEDAAPPRREPMPKAGADYDPAASAAAVKAAREAQATRFDPEERAQEKARRDMAQAVKKELRRRDATFDWDVWSAIARGVISDGKHLRALAPTAQVGQLAVAYKRRPAILSRPQLAALCHYRDLWLATHVGVGAIDPAAIRVDGGGGGDATHRMGKAIDANRELIRLSRTISDPYQRELVDWVVLKDQPLDTYSRGPISQVQLPKSQMAVRYAMLAGGATVLALELGYLTSKAL